MEETVEATRARVGSTPPLDPGRLTIVLTTSPIKTHPSTRLIEEVFESAAVLAGLGGCRKIIVADGVKVREHDKFRSGICTPDAMANYGHYLSRLDALTKTEGSPLCGAELLALDERHGFAHALRRGLMRVATPFVLVAQHDRSFVRPVEVSHVLDVMERVNTNTQCPSSGRVNYVGFPTTTTLSHETYVASKYGLAVEPVTFPVRDAKVTGSNPVGSSEYDTRPSTLRLLPLVQFYDSMHVASTRWYLSRGFGRARYTNLPRGGFIEDTLGQHMLKTIRSECAGEDGRANDANAVAASHSMFGTYIYQDDTGETKCGHIDGHDVLTVNGSCRKYGFGYAHTGETRWREIECDTGAGHWGEGAYERVMGYRDDPGSVALSADMNV